MTNDLNKQKTKHYNTCIVYYTSRNSLNKIVNLLNSEQVSKSVVCRNTPETEFQTLHWIQCNHSNSQALDSNVQFQRSNLISNTRTRGQKNKKRKQKGSKIEIPRRAESPQKRPVWNKRNKRPSCTREIYSFPVEIFLHGTQSKSYFDTRIQRVKAATDAFFRPDPCWIFLFVVRICWFPFDGTSLFQNRTARNTPVL